MSPRVLRNRGRLVSREDKAEYDVIFEFEVSSDPTHGTAQTDRQTIWGEVSTTDKVPLPEGEYDLHVSTGETLHVENTGLAGWHVIPKRLQVPTSKNSTATSSE